MEAELTLAEEDRIAGQARAKRAMKEQIEGSIAAFEQAIPVIDRKIQEAENTLATVGQLSEIAATLPANLAGSINVLLLRGSDHRQSIADARHMLVDLLAGTREAQQARLDRVIEQRAKAARELARLRVVLQTEYDD